MSNIVVKVDLPSVQGEGKLKGVAAALGKSAAETSSRYPEWEIWYITVNNGDGTFNLRDSTNTLHKSRVVCIDAAGVKYLKAGMAVIVGYYNRDRGRPYIKGLSGSAGGFAPGRALTFWTQSAATHLQNNCSPDECRVFPLLSSGSPIYTYSNDSRAKVYGLVSYRDGAKSLLALAYPVFGSGSALQSYKIDVIGMDGSLSQSFTLSTATLSPFGNWSSFGQFFLNPKNLHFLLTPFTTEEQVIWRAWVGPGETQVSSINANGNVFTSSAYEKILNSAYSLDYSGGGGGATPTYWPVTFIYPFTGSLLGSIQGLSRDGVEQVKVEWTKDPKSLSAFGERGIISSCSGALGGWPASPDGSSWTVAISEREIFDHNIPPEAALLYGYKPKTGGSVDFNFRSFAKQLKLHVTELDASSGKPIWTHTITQDPSPPVIDEGLLGPMDSYIQNPFGTGLIPEDRIVYNYSTDPPAAYTFSTRWGGRVSEGLLPSDFEWIEGLPIYLEPHVYPGRIRDPYVNLGANFQWPTFLYFQGPILLFPRAQGNDVRPLGANPYSSSFYDGNRCNFRCLTEFMQRSDGCTPGIRRDTDGNIYFAYARPFPFFIGGQLLSLPSILPGETRTTHYHNPNLVYGGETFQVSLTSKGAVRWVRDLTMRLPGCSWWTASHVFSEFPDTVIGGTAGTPLPVVGNVWEPGMPIGRFLFTVREVRSDIDYRPDLYLDIAEAANGNNLVNTVYLTNYGGADAFDRLSADVPDPDNPGATLAIAGERVWFSQNVRIKGAIDGGVEWALMYIEQLKRDRTIFKRQLITLQAPTDKSIGQWSDIGTWEPGPGEGPTAGDFDSMVLVNGGYYWNQWDGTSQRIYAKTL